jgi:hypothetical protein
MPGSVASGTLCVTQWAVRYVAASGLIRNIYNDLSWRDLSRDEMPGASVLLNWATTTALQRRALCIRLKINGLCKLESTEGSFTFPFRFSASHR